MRRACLRNTSKDEFFSLNEVKKIFVANSPVIKGLAIRPYSKNYLRIKHFRLFLMLALIPSAIKCQVIANKSFIKDMKWGIDYSINLTLYNDSSYTIQIKDMIHSQTVNDSLQNGFVYYPVMLARDFVDKLKESKNLEISSTATSSDNSSKPLTLWGALHNPIGGGWVHFINCMLYALETRYLSLTAPLMERPKTSWKPKPMTKTYKRTHKWKYYVPVEQSEAKKEYKKKAKENQLNDLHDVPVDFINLFRKTNNKNYQQIIDSRDIQKQARIDLVKLLLGASYLGEPQISYIKSMVQKAILQYSFNQLPTIIIFDDLDAAVVMSLNETGYNLEKVLFRVKDLSEEEKNEKQAKIELTIRTINKANQKIFEEKLKKYYQ
jgi:hypothetical protein